MPLNHSTPSLLNSLFTPDSGSGPHPETENHASSTPCFTAEAWLKSKYIDITYRTGKPATQTAYGYVSLPNTTTVYVHRAVQSRMNRDVEYALAVARRIDGDLERCIHHKMEGVTVVAESYFIQVDENGALQTAMMSWARKEESLPADRRINFSEFEPLDMGHYTIYSELNGETGVFESYSVNNRAQRRA